MTKNVQSDEIKSLSVSNLFGRFNHCIRFPKSNDILIITAPNGYGKTVLLRIIDSIFNRKFSFFRKIDFDEIQVAFASGKSLSIYKKKKRVPHDKDDSRRNEILFKSGDKSFTLSRSRLRNLERYLPFDRIAPDNWHDLRTDRIFSTDEIIDLYADQLPKSLDTNLLKSPEWLKDISSCVNAHLVEAQRLLYIENRELHRPSRKLLATPPSVVEKDASDLAERIRQLLQQYANESQKLDETFPKRILKIRDGKVSDENEIQDNLQDLTKKRDNLVSVGLLDAAVSEPIKPSDVFQEENIRRILEIYAEDTRKKLGIFDETYKKIRLFKQILDDRFSFKTIEFDARKGIRAVDKDNEQTIPLPDLSSGEQHELVLIYELLFKVEEGSIILIDEPELSLHVVWQRNFIADLQKIQELKRLKVVIATHSPQIIHDKWNLVQELKK